MALSAGLSDRSCCYRHKARGEAGFCPDCGKPAIRCMAHSECGSILNDGERCEVCVAPKLTLDAGAMVEARLGGGLSLPLSMTNTSPTELPLFVTAVYSREGRGEWQAEPQSWERLDRGKSAPVVVHADNLDRVGTHRVEVLVLVATRWRWREERYAFTAGLTLNIAEPDDQGGHNIQISGDSVGPTTIYVSDRRTTGERAGSGAGQPVELALTRADTAERDFGLRGHEGGLITPKSASLRFVGFRKTEAPASGLISGEGGMYRFGRERTEAEGGQGDVRLIVRDRAGMEDEDLSARISRHHFDLYVESSCLKLRVQGQNGLKVNTANHRRGDVVELSPGDVIRPVASAPDTLGLQLDFDVFNGVTDTVVISRRPSDSGA